MIHGFSKIKENYKYIFKHEALVKKMKWKLITAILVITGFLMIGPMANAASFNFTAHDPTDVTNADFDITSFGAEDNGNTVTFWMQVRGNINEHPADGYGNIYVIDVEDDDTSEEVTMVAGWINTSGQTTPIIYAETESGTSFLSPGEYTISGGRVEFNLDTSLFSGIGNNYTVKVITAHSLGSNPTAIGNHYDDATYSSSSENSGGNSTPSGNFPWSLLWWILIALIIIIVVIVLVVLLVVHKSAQPQQPPQQPPQPPSEPPWEE